MFEHISSDTIQRVRSIKLLILDVDGVLTNGQLLIGESGEIFKSFNTLDGIGIKMLQQSGIQTAVITARNDAAVTARVEQLGITHYFKGMHNKKLAYEQIRHKIQLTELECAFVGDDVIDLPVMIRCGFPVAVQNAHPFVKEHAAYITQNFGGAGAVREVTDLIMHAQNTLQTALEEYTK